MFRLRFKPAWSHRRGTLVSFGRRSTLKHRAAVHGHVAPVRRQLTRGLCEAGRLLNKQRLIAAMESAVWLIHEQIPSLNRGLKNDGRDANHPLQLLQEPLP